MWGRLEVRLILALLPRWEISNWRFRLVMLHGGEEVKLDGSRGVATHGPAAGAGGESYFAQDEAILHYRDDHITREPP